MIVFPPRCACLFQCARGFNVSANPCVLYSLLNALFFFFGLPGLYFPTLFLFGEFVVKIPKTGLPQLVRMRTNFSFRPHGQNNETFPKSKSTHIHVTHPDPNMGADC